ncbi:hypothetical protein SLEP1_g43022 [Rubroshorea leprosula]|uniref:DNA2/NAM7 helicase-like C-terminal domain-containing protein n=1 Tax=Rubroshorea leprosula TaxID=152421 RepID=A0AAV5LC91_9ROSI|nr:hypothetical protein SLEP1_g43022 [Rubroshorea leprosula]
MLRCNKDSPKYVEISTSDGFQGQEKEATIISIFWSNYAKELGFSRDHG